MVKFLVILAVEFSVILVLFALEFRVMIRENNAEERENNQNYSGFGRLNYTKLERERNPQ